MFGWRKRKDGFEWQEYVRTTILVRRRNRRERLEEAGHAAVEGLKAAGQRGAAAGAVGAQALGRGAKEAGQRGAAAGIKGAQVLGRGAKVAGQRGAEVGLKGAQAFAANAKAAGYKGMVLSAAGARAAGSRLRVGLPRLWLELKSLGRWTVRALDFVWTGLSAVAARVARMLAPVLGAGWRGLEPIFAKLREPSLVLPLAVAGGVAFFGGIWRIFVRGAESDTLVALAIGLVILCALLAARISAGAPAWLAMPSRWAGENLPRLRRRLGQFGAVDATLLRRGAVIAALALVAAVGWMAWRPAPGSERVANTTSDSSTLQGRAVAVSGDTLRIASTTVRISGIEAPGYGQVCISGKSRKWRCDVYAEAALSRLLGGGRVTCALAGTDDDGHRIAKCRRGETDIAAELVEGGHVFATKGLFAPYTSLESKAHAARAGVWSGDEAPRPSEYRAQKWEEAKRDAPDGCPIKGNVKGGRRIYVLPWARGYERVRVSLNRGGRWFCSEDEARAAGWQRSEQS